MSGSREAIRRLAGEASTATEPRVALSKVAELRRAVDDFERQQVARALTDGASFATLARDLGVSRQAAHRRFRGLGPLRVAEDDHHLLVTPEVRLAIEHARDEAGRLGAASAGGEHVVLAVLRQEDVGAAAVLSRAGVTLEAARRAARSLTEAPSRGDLRRILVAAAHDALRRRDDRVEVEHLLLAALANSGGAAHRLLRVLHVAPEDVSKGVDALIEPWLG